MVETCFPAEGMQAQPLLLSQDMSNIQRSLAAGPEHSEAVRQSASLQVQQKRKSAGRALFFRDYSSSLQSEDIFRTALFRYVGRCPHTRRPTNGRRNKSSIVVETTAVSNASPFLPFYVGCSLMQNVRCFADFFWRGDGDRNSGERQIRVSRPGVQSLSF